MNFKNYDLVSAGDLAIMGQDPTAQDLATLLAASAGDYSIMGNELDDLDLGGIMGADGGGNGNGGGVSPSAMQAVMRAKLADASLLLRQDKPTRAREYPLGFLSDAPVAAGGIVTVTSRPQIVFRPERLVVPSDIAGQFSIIDVIIGKNPQNVANVAVPARVFDERGVGVRMAMDTAQISQDIAIRVQNISGAAATFRAAMIGASVE